MSLPSARALLLSLAWLAAVASTHLGLARPAGHRALPYLAAHAAATALCLLAWRSLRARADLVLVVAAGLVGRALLVPAPSRTTTDVARYLWDGAVALAGHDPYALAPTSPALAGLAASPPLDHLDVATCYPPLALGLFTLAAGAGPRGAWWAWKGLCAAASALTVWAAWRHLREGERARDVTLVAWSPLLALEAGVGAHLDVYAALAVTVALVASARRQRGCAFVAAGVAAAVKLLPGVVLLPLLARARRPLRAMALAAAPLALSFAAAELAGLTAPGSLPLVAGSWSFASPLWSLGYALAPDDDASLRAGLALGGVALAALVSLRPGPLARNVRDALGVALVASPVLYPWYGCALAAATAFAPAAWPLALLAVAPASYEVLDAYQARGVWAPAGWPAALEATALAAGLAWDVRAWWRSVS